MTVSSRTKETREIDLSAIRLVDLQMIRDIVAMALDSATAKISGHDRRTESDGQRSDSKQTSQRRTTSGSGTSQSSKQTRSGNGRSSKGYVPTGRSQQPDTQQGRSRNGDYSPTSRTGSSQYSAQTSRRKGTWAIPVGERPDLPFDQGQTGLLFDCLPTMLKDSPGAALAVVTFVAMHRSHRYQGRALNDRTRLLTQCTPNMASLVSASDASWEMRNAAIDEDKLSADLTYYEQQFMLLASGRRADHTPRKIADELLAIAEEFSLRHHPRREASSRIMAAAILLVDLRDFTRANEEMVKAIALIGVAYPDDTMIELAKSANPQLVEQLVNSKSDKQPDPANFRG
jgi:DNA mismatch repair ATPase MutL